MFEGKQEGCREMNQPFVQALHLLLEGQADLQVLKGLAHPNINKK